MHCSQNCESAATATITDAVTLAQVNTDVGNLNDLTTGKITLNEVADTYANVQEIKKILDAQVDMGAANVTVTSQTNITEINDLRDNDTTGNITINDVSESKDNLATIKGYGDVSLAAANISVTDVVTKDQADTIHGYNTAAGTTVTLSSVSDAFSNIDALQGTAGVVMTGATITATNAEAVTKANATKLDGFTNKTVTVASVKDTRSNVTDISDLGGVDMSNAVATIDDAVSLSQATDLNLLTDGKITLTAVSDTRSNITTLAGINDALVDMGIDHESFAWDIQVTVEQNNEDIGK